MSQSPLGSVFPFTNPSGKKVFKVQIPTGQYSNGYRKFTTRTAPTEAQARALQRKLYVEFQNNKLIPAREDKLEKYAIWWVRSVKANHVRTSTASDYEYKLRRWILPYLGQCKLSSIEPAVIENWMNELRKQGLGDRTVNSARTVLSGVLGYAHQSGILNRNPTSLVSPHRRKRGEKTQVQEPWTSEEIDHALTAVHNTKFDLFTHLGALYGLRRGEILGLKWSDIDLENGIINIRRTLKEERTYNEAGFSKAKLATDDPKTIASARKIGIGLVVDAAIFRHRQFVLKAAEMAGNRWMESDWLIPSAIGGPWNPNNASRQFKTFCKNNEIRIIRVHDLRHTAATEGLGKGVRLEAVSQALGHSRIETTKSIYAPYVQPLVDEFTTTMDDSHSGTLLVQLDNELSEWGEENGSPIF